MDLLYFADFFNLLKLNKILNVMFYNVAKAPVTPK